MQIIDTDLDFSSMHARMQWYVDQGILPCVNTLVMRGTEVVDFARFGFMDSARKRPLSEDAIFRMYSNTKLVTSVAAMTLYEQGAFALDDPIANYLPEFADPRVLRTDAKSIDDVVPAQSPITVRQTLSHSAGWSYGFIEPESIIDQAYSSKGANPLAPGGHSLEELIQVLGHLPLAYQPGTAWRYSLATDVTARLVEVLADQPFDDYLQTTIFAPLGMHDTGFWVPETKLDRFVTMYAPADLFDPMKPGLNDAGPDTQYLSKPKFLSGGGGLVSTVGDYLSFIRMIVNGGEWDGAQILRSATLELMRTNQLAEGLAVNFPMWDMPGTVFGLGFALKQTLRADEPAAALDEYHWGGIAGTHSWMAPRANLTGLCMTQLMPGFWHPFSHDFKKAVYETFA